MRSRPGRAFRATMIPFPECENISFGTANPLHVTLLVAGDDTDDAGQSLRDTLAPGVVVVDAAAVGDALARHDPDVVVVDAAAVADPSSVVAAVRSAGDSRVSVVSVGSVAIDADVTRTSRNPDDLRAAVDHARRVAAYRRSVSTLYEACRDRELGRPDEALRASRADADRRFADLPDDQWAVEAALRPDVGNEHDDPDAGGDDGASDADTTEGANDG